MARVYSPDDVAIALPLKMRIVPVASVVLASLSVTLPMGASAPLWPPLGFMMLLAWRMMRNTLWPVWVGLPLGLIDDLASGQPVGSAVALWSIALLAMDVADRRLIWRDAMLDWGLASLGVLLYLVLSALFAGAGNVLEVLVLVGPQAMWSMLLLPLAMRVVAWLDRWRTTR